VSSERASIGTVSLDQIRDEAERLLADVGEGEDLDPVTASLIEIGVRCAVTSLDAAGASTHIELALAAGATPEQVQEVLTLVSGLGVHSLMVGTPLLARAMRERGDTGLQVPLDEQRAELWDRYVGANPYWESFEQRVPGFLEALVRLSPEAFAAFFDYCAVPWRSGALASRTLELVALATDATPTHRFLPGALLHLDGAINCGAGRREVIEALQIASQGPATT
jgi:alkylhydroperoxidase/carboxymuconolactone decarboxylase family protein YurZ